LVWQSRRATPRCSTSSNAAIAKIKGDGRLARAQEVGTSLSLAFGEWGHEMEFVKTSAVDGHVGIVTLDRPAKLNAMTRPMYREISDALIAMDADKDVWAIIVNSSNPKAFSAGADLSILHAVLTDGPFEWNP
jgi:hypothetical protein